MKRASRDLSKNPPLTTTPVSYRDVSTVYRSLSAVPATLDVSRNLDAVDKQFAKLVGPQSKGHGEVVWTEKKQNKTQTGEAQPCPIPLIVANAPHQSLLVESNPVSKVVNSVHELLKQHNVDAVFDSTKFKWKCVCYDGDVETRFVSRLFSVPGRSNFFVLDFQRRCGDPFHFQSVYRAINFRLLKSGFIVCNENRADAKMEEPPFRTFKPLSLPEIIDNDESDGSVTMEDLEPLCRMCTSAYLDVQREGLTALAAQIASNSSVRKMLASFTGTLMEIVSLTRDAQVRRLAVSAVAKLSAESSVTNDLVAKGGLRVLVNLMVNPSETLETRRHCANALLNIHQLDSSTKEVVIQTANVGDVRLDAMIGELKAKITVGN